MMIKKRREGNFKHFLLLLLLILLVPLFIRTGYLLSIMIFVGIHAIIVLGLIILQGYTGQVSMGHAGFMAIGSYSSAILSVSLGFSPWVSIILAVVFSMVVSLFVGFATLRIQGYYLALATLAFGLLIYNLILEFDQLTRGTSGIRNIPNLKLGGMVIESDLAYYFLVWMVVLVIFIFTMNISKSPFGLFMKGVEADEVAVSVLGINTFMIKIKVLLFSAAMAGLGGALYAHYVNFISPDVFIIDRSVLLLMMVIVGGSRYPWGGIVGALLLTFIPEYLRAYRDISIGIYGLIMMLIILYLPGGFASIPDIIRKKQGEKNLP